MKPLLLLTAALFALALSVSAQTTYLWTNLVSGNGSGSWNTAANWNPAGPASGVGNTAQFTLPLTNASTPGTITLDSSPTIGNLFFGNTSASNLSWTVNAGTPATSVLNLSVSSGTPSISVTNRGVTFGAPLVSLQGFNLSGGGQLTLNTTNNFGTVSNSVAAGVLDLNTLTALPAGTVVGVSNGASVVVPLAGTYASNNITLTGGGASSEANPGALYFGGGGVAAVTWPAPIGLNGNATISSYGVTYNTTLGGVISGAGNLTLSARGGSVSSHTAVFNLNNQSTYAGTTTFLNNGGLLSAKWVFGANNALPAATSLSVNNGNPATYAILDFAGFNQTLAALTLNGTATTAYEYLTNSSVTIPTLTLNTNAGTVFGINEGTNNINNLTLTVGSAGNNATATTIGVNGATLLNVSNVTWNSSFYTDLGDTAATVINLYQGTTLNNSGELLMGYGNGNATNTLNLNSGAVVNAHYIRVGNNAVSTLNLNAGATVTADEIYSDYTNNCSFYFNGGLLQPNTAPTTPWFAASLTNVQVLAGGALINNGGDNLAVTASLLAGSPNGGLTALGSGTLALQGTNNTYTGSTVISNGTLAVDGRLPASWVTNYSALAGTGYVATATLNAGSQLYPGRNGAAGTLSLSNLTTIGGSEMYFDLSTNAAVLGGGTNDLLLLTNATFGSQTLVGLDFLNGFPGASNRYVLAAYSGSATGLGNLALDPLDIGTRAAMGLDTSVSHQIAVILTNGVASISNLIWYAGGANNNWDLNNSANWNVNANTFYNQDGVIFNDTAQTNVVNLAGVMYPASVVFSNNSLTYTLTGSGQLTGASGLKLSGGAKVIVDASFTGTGTNYLNNAAAILQIGNGDTAGAIGPADVVATVSGATLAYNRTDANTLNNRIWGNAFIPNIQANSGTLTLAGAADNSYATATVNSGGTLVLAKTSSATVHAVGGSPYALTINAGGMARLAGAGGDQIVNSGNVQSDGLLDLNGQSETINNLTGVNGTGVVTNSAAGAAVLSVGGANTNVAYNGLFVSGTAGTVGLTAVGTGSVILTNANTATGPLTLAGSAYVYLSNVTAQAWSGPVVFTNVGVSTRLEFLANQQLAPTSVISFSGTAERRVELNGFTETIGGLNDLAGVTGNVIVEPATDNTPNEPGTLVLNVASGVTDSTGGYIRNTAGGAGSILTLIKTGAGTQIFSGVPGLVSYSGPTTVSNGVLEVSGAGSVLGNSAITLAGGTIDFAGGGTLGNNLSGSGLLQVGGGTLIVTNTPNFTGNTFISAGTLQLGNSAFIGSLASPFITNNGTLYITNSTASTINLTNVIKGTGSMTLLMNGGQLVLSGSNSNWTGGLTFAQNVANNALNIGFVVVSNSTALGSTNTALTIALNNSTGAGIGGVELTGGVHVDPNKIITFGGRTVTAANAALQNLSGNNTWAGPLVIAGAGGGYPINCVSGQLELSGGMLNTVASSTRGFQLFGAGNYLLDGVITNGSSTALTQIQFSGTGVSVVAGTNNSYSGTTTISSGTVLVTGLIPTNTVTVATNATVGGNGLILGATTIQGGGNLMPGLTGLDTTTLTVSNSLSLLAGSTNAFCLDRTNAQTASEVAGLTTVAYGGTLLLTNVGTPLQSSDTFKLFNAAGYSGSFSKLTPSTPGTGLVWDTSKLTLNGTLFVGMLPTNNVTPSPATVTYGNNVVLTTSAGGTTPLYYQWYSNNIAISGQTGAALTLTIPAVAASGNYSVVVTNAYGNVSNTVVVTINPATPVVTATGGTFTYNGAPQAGSGSATGGAGGSLPVTLSYNGTGGTTYGPTAVAPTAAGTYMVTASTAGDANDTANSSLPAALTINQANPLVTFASSENPSGYKDQVIFTMNLPAAATGNVTFLTNGVSFDTEPLATGAAMTTNSTLPRATNLVTAIYPGDGNYLPVTNTLNQIVTNHPPAASVMIVTRTEGLALVIPLSAMATNWSDVDGDAVELTGVNMQSTNGVNLMALNWTTNLDGSLVTTNADADIGYTNGPNAADQISYSISDGQGGTNIGYVEIVINSSVTGTNSITAFNPGAGSNTITAYGIPFYFYILERATNLSSPVWVDIQTNQAATNGLINATDTFWDLSGVSPNPSAFYQLKWQP